MRKISEMVLGSESHVVDITAEPTMRERLLEMGVAPGRSVKLLRRMPLAGPYVIQVGSMFLALRGEEAQHVWVGPAV